MQINESENIKCGGGVVVVLRDKKYVASRNLIDKFNQMLVAEKKNAARLEAVYYRLLVFLIPLIAHLCRLLFFQ